MTVTNDPARTRLGRVADLLAQAASELRIFARTCGGDLALLGQLEAQCDSPARERAQDPMPTTETTRDPARARATTPSKLLTQREIADLMHVGERTVRRLRSDPRARFPEPMRRARALRWRRTDVEAWIEGRRP